MDIKKLKDEVEKVKDPRREWGNKRHKLEDIIIIGLCSVMSCGEDFVDMEEFGNDREDWLREFLELPNGIPDSDTFRRVFERVDSAELSACLHAWLDDAGRSGGRGVHIDGKTICGSKSPNHKAYHVVSAFVSENSITLGEVTTAEKSNEITAIPELLELLDIEGDIVTIDAMGCQADIASKIRGRKADYMLALKENQQSLYEEAREHFAWLEREHPKDELFECYDSGFEKNHGRIEHREVAIASAEWLSCKNKWPDVSTLIQCRCTREIAGVRSNSTRYYISSFDGTANDFADLVRGHWSIENGLHWMLDVAFREDAARARKDNSPLNMNVLRKISLSLLKAVKLGRLSVHKKMLKASRDVRFLESLLR